MLKKIKKTVLNNYLNDEKTTYKNFVRNLNVIKIPKNFRL